MYVYRVEDEEGFGPYRNEGKHCDLLEILMESHTPESHPTPMGDDLMRYYDLSSEDRAVSRFGFATAEQLDSWFSQHYDALRANGFSVAVYQVPDLCVLQGKKQCVFPINRAEHVDTLDFAYFC